MSFLASSKLLVHPCRESVQFNGIGSANFYGESGHVLAERAVRDAFYGHALALGCFGAMRLRIIRDERFPIRSAVGPTASCNGPPDC